MHHCAPPCGISATADFPECIAFLRSVVAGCRQSEPELLIATGMAPLTGAALRTLRAMGIVCVNYSTDDPWNPVLRAFWHLRVLPEFFDAHFHNPAGEYRELRRILAAPK